LTNFSLTYGNSKFDAKCAFVVQKQAA
jgi:hypothetical protein